MSKKMHLQTLAAAVALATCANAWAVDPQAIDIGGLGFVPTLTVSEAHDDNVFADRNGQSSWVTTINPTFVLGAETAKSGYQLKYSLNRELYHSVHNADNTDHYLTGEAAFAFDARNRLKLQAGYSKTEDTVDTAVAGQLDKFTTKNVGGVYTYGAETAKAQVDVGANYLSKRTDNSGNVNAEKEYDATTVNSIFYYRVAPKTKALAEIRHTDYDYELNTSTLDSTNMAYLVGATWEATARTTGTVKFGYEEKDFDSSLRKDRESPMWEVGVSWAPRTYSTFSLNARRAFDEGDDGASVIKSQNIGANWKHYWLERLYSEVSYSITEKKYQDVRRTDDLQTFGLGLTYEARRWLDIGVGYKYTENESTLGSESYDRNIVGVSVTASL
jgi:hypothetical protein